MTMDDDADGTGLPHVWNVLDRMTTDDVRAICRDVKDSAVGELARAVGVPRVVLTRDSSADRTLRNRIRRNSNRAKLAVEVMVRPTRDLAIAALGPERSTKPSYDDLVEVLPGLLERHGARRVALLLAFAVDDEWEAAEPSRQLLDTDERFSSEALGPRIDDDTPAEHARRPTDHRPAPTERPKRTKSKRKPAPTKRDRPSYKRKRAPDAADEADVVAVESSDPPAVTLNGRAIDPSAHQRREVRLVGSYRALDRSDPLVGRVVIADVVFDGPIAGSKTRPCVVIAVSGVADLVVRPCYSEGGRRADDFRSVAVSDPVAAGLDRNTFVSHEERCIHRTAVAGELGWLPLADWNQL